MRLPRWAFGAVVIFFLLRRHDPAAGGDARHRSAYLRRYRRRHPVRSFRLLSPAAHSPVAQGQLPPLSQALAACAPRVHAGPSRSLDRRTSACEGRTQRSPVPGGFINTTRAASCVTAMVANLGEPRLSASRKVGGDVVFDSIESHRRGDSDVANKSTDFLARMCRVCLYVCSGGEHRRQQRAVP